MILSMLHCGKCLYSSPSIMKCIVFHPNGGEEQQGLFKTVTNSISLSNESEFKEVEREKCDDSQRIGTVSSALRDRKGI